MTRHCVSNVPAKCSLWQHEPLDNENIFIDTKVNTNKHTHTHKNVIWTIFQRTLSPHSWKWLICWLWSRMSYRIHVCDAADNKVFGMGCRARTGLYFHCSTEPFRQPTFLWHIHNSHSQNRLDDSRHANVVTEVKLPVSQSDYARTTCIIRFFGSYSPEW